MEDLKTDPRAVYGDYLACRDCDLVDRLGELSVPALVIFGEDEIPPLREQSELLAQRIPGATRVEVPKAGHMVHFEQPDEVARAVASFLEGLDR
jgi:pimeloyl-ACP methyl ester carboxylesterase